MNKGCKVSSCRQGITLFSLFSPESSFSLLSFSAFCKLFQFRDPVQCPSINLHLVWNVVALACSVLIACPLKSSLLILLPHLLSYVPLQSIVSIKAKSTFVLFSLPSSSPLCPFPSLPFPPLPSPSSPLPESAMVAKSLHFLDTNLRRRSNVEESHVIETSFKACVQAPGAAGKCASLLVE